MKLLVIEDEQRVADFLSRGLQAEGHSVTVAKNGQSGLALALAGEFAVIVLDVMLPDLSGLEVCRRIRAAACSTPVLVLSALDSTEDKITGLRLGADDYLAKPFSFNELLARIDALARRGKVDTPRPDITQIGPLIFDRSTLTVIFEGQRLELTAKELALLDLLMSSPGKVFSRAVILDTVWGQNADPLTNIVDVYVHRLRGKLQRPDSPVTPIATVRGVGFRLDPAAFQ